MKYKKKPRRKLKPSSYVLISKLNALEAILADLDPEEAIQRMEEAEAPLNMLALQDPIEATLIYNACPEYFDEAIEPDEYYIGQGVYIDKAQLAELDTPEKRAAYIAEIDAEFETGQSGSGPIVFNGGEPVKLEGFDPAAIALQ